MNRLGLGGLLACSTLLASSAAAQTELTMWKHGAGAVEERQILDRIIDDFHGKQTDWTVSVESFPQESHNDSVVAGALAGDLPCIIDIDGPVMPNWAWAGYLQPLPISAEALAGHLDSTIGRWDGETYTVGLFDAALAIYARQSTLDSLGLRTPTIENPWSGEEFMTALEAAKNSGEYEYAFDAGMAWTGEWYPYAFSPFLQSFGGDIIDRSSYLTAEGVLNGDEALAFGEWWQSLFTNGYAPGTSQDPADRESGFINGKYAFQWNGNWAGASTIDGGVEDVLFLPAPDFGNGPIIGGASWQFGVSADCEHPEGVAAFIEFALQDEYLAAYSDSIGLIPATQEAAAMTERYREGGSMEAFFGLSEAQALVRPVTPGYVVGAKVFEKALADIANGADVADSLDAAVDEIDADIKANDGYGH